MPAMNKYYNPIASMCNRENIIVERTIRFSLMNIQYVQILFYKQSSRPTFGISDINLRYLGIGLFKTTRISIFILLEV